MTERDAAPKYLAVRNLKKFQHYRDRKPPWIKLYSSVLDDYAFSCLQDASKAHAMLIWVLASQHENKLPNDAKWIAGKIGASDPVDLDALVAAGYLVPWAEDTECKQDASNTLAEDDESATPREQRTENRKKLSKAAEPPDERIEAVLEHYRGKHPKRRPGNAKDISAIKRALKVYSVDEIRAAIDGNAGDAWHMEHAKNELTYVLRDSGKIDQFIALSKAPALPAGAPRLMRGGAGPDPAAAWYALLRDNGLLTAPREQFQATVARLVSEGAIPDRDEFMAQCKRVNWHELRNQSAERFAVEYVRTRVFPTQGVA